MKERFVNNAKRSAAVYLLLLASTMLWAQGPNSSGTYYQNANGKSGSELKTAMFNIIKTHTTLSYNNLTSYYEQTDKRSDGKVRDWYSNATSYSFSQCTGSYSKEGDMYNREHSFPASWFSDASPMYSDIVHVVPADGYVNNRRSNYLLGKVETVSYSSKNGYSKLGTCATSGYSGIVFEPNDEIKGDLARIYFYMVTCYQDKISSWSSNATVSNILDGNTYSGYKSWYLTMLMEWSKNDPVDAVEIARNNAVKNVQGNRNPFVDYPGLEEYIWGDLKTTAFSYDNYVEPSSSSTTTVATPVISGTTPFTTSSSVTITCSTSGATIYYTTDGSTPSASNGTQYSAPFTLTATTTVKAIAIKDNTSSSVATQTFTKSDGTSTEGNEFTLITKAADFEEGDYIIVYDGGAMNTTVSNDRLQYTAVTPSNNVITTDDAAIIWHIAPSGNYYTIYNAGESKYAASTGTKNQAQLLASGTDNKSLWSVTPGATFEFVNKNNSSNNVNANLRRNGTYGFACYATGTGGALSLYKRTSGSSTTTKQDVTMSFSPSTASATVGESFTEPTLTTTPSGLTVTYSSSTPSVATVNSSTGDVTLVAAGETTITATFAGNDSYNGGSASYTLTVNTAPVLPTTPTNLALSDVESTSMTATWTAATNATSYELDIVKGSSFEASTGGAVLESDFSDTSGWSLSGTDTYTNSPYIGSGSPSIKFDNSGDYAISPDFGSGAKLQFWAYGNNGSGSTFKISGLVNNVWTDIETVTIANGGATYQVNLPTGTSKVRFDFTKSVNCALDDVVVYGPSNSPEAVDGYPKSVGNVTSYAITGLTSETQYAVRVRAVNGSGNSDWSSTATATTTVANSAPVWSAFPNASVTLGGGDVELIISDYVTGTPTPAITLASTTASSADYDFDPNDGYFTFTPSATGTFTFTFTATNSEGSANATLTVTVNPAPVTVPALAVTESGITSTSAPASWTACDGVSSYTLQLASDDLFSTGGESVVLINEGFDNGTTLPDGWTVVSGSIGGTYTSSGNYGSSSPSLKFSNTVTLSTPTLSNPTDISFWYKGNGNSLTSTLVVEQLVSGSWDEVGSATISGSANTFSHSLNSAATQVRFVFTKASGNVAFDDVIINGTSGPGSLISSTTVNGTSYTFTGLTPETTYYARVKGNADWSNVESFTTNAVLTLDNAADNSAAISTAATSGKKYDVTLSNRTLYKDGAWNTLVLPFDVTIADSPLAGATVMKLNSSTSGLSGNTLTLNFENETTTMTAGTPYIIKWTTTGNPIETPTFNGVTIDNTSTEVSFTGGKFKGTYVPVTYTSEDKSVFFMGSNNTLRWPQPTDAQHPVTINAFRCYFELNDGTGNVKDFVLNFGDNDATEVQGVEGVQDVQDDSWYDLSGRKIVNSKLSNGKLPKGIYIYKGRKVIL